MKLYSKGELILFLIFFVILFLNCTEKYPSELEKFTQEQESSCTSCHLDFELLKEVADPLPPDEGHSGEG